jgi:hypothetical protein
MRAKQRAQCSGTLNSNSFSREGKAAASGPPKTRRMFAYFADCCFFFSAARWTLVSYSNHSLLRIPVRRSMQDPASFGVISSQANNPRAIQFGLRLEF